MKVLLSIVVLLVSACTTVPEVRQRFPSLSQQQSVGVGENVYQYVEVPAYLDDKFYGAKRPVDGLGTGEIDTTPNMQTLVYSGLSNGELVFNYFQSGPAVGNFDAQAQYDYTPGANIAYRGASITVLKADNNEIVYVVNNGFSNEQSSESQ